MPGRVLIVEDQFLIAMALEDTITQLGYEVLGSAASRSQAEDHDAIDIALVDINLLDGATGIEIARMLARNGASVVVMTANPEAVTSGIDGVVGVLTKPVEDRDLRRTLAFVEQRRRGKNPACPEKLRLFENAGRVC